jgi:hypothetical protein
MNKPCCLGRGYPVLRMTDSLGDCETVSIGNAHLTVFFFFFLIIFHIRKQLRTLGKRYIIESQLGISPSSYIQINLFSMADLLFCCYRVRGKLGTLEEVKSMST